MKKAMFTRVCAILGIGAAVIFGANGSFAAGNVWRYYAATEEGNPTNVACVVQSPWVISVAIDNGRVFFDKAAGTITLQKCLAGEGVLDMRGFSVSYMDGEELKETEILNLSFQTGYPWENFQTCRATEFYAGSNLSKLPEFGRRGGGTAAGKTLKKVYVESDLVTGVIDYQLGAMPALTNLVLKCPNLITIASGYGFSGTAITNDISDFCTPAIQTFAGDFNGDAYVTGSFVSTNHTGSMAGVTGLCVTNLYLEGPYAGEGGSKCLGQIFRGRGTLETVTFKWPNIWDLSSAYSNIGRLRELTIDMPNLTNVVSGFFSSYKLEKVTVLGKPLPTNVVDRLVEYFTAFNDPNVVTTKVWNGSSLFWRGRGILYCSKKQGWDKMRSRLTPNTYEATNAPAGCFGVYVTANGERKAWMVHLPQPEDPTGFCIRVQ